MDININTPQQYKSIFVGDGAFDIPTIYRENPDPLVRHATAYLQPESKIIDVGAAYGENSIFLATLGHDVTAVELYPEVVKSGEQLLRSLGSVALKHKFVTGDMRNITDQSASFDALIATRSLQMLDPQEVNEFVKKLQRITRPNGLHVIKAYITHPTERSKMPVRALFTLQELHNLYDSWDLLHFSGKPKPLDQSSDGKWWCGSLLNIIARKPAPKTDPILIKQAEYYKRSDPELAAMLFEQAYQTAP